MFRDIIFFLTLLFFTPSYAFAQVVITEIMYDLEGSDAGREWIEIKNEGGVLIDFSEKVGANYRWRVSKTSGNHQIIPFQGGNGVAHLGLAVIALDPTKFLEDWPNFSGILLKSSFNSFNNTGEAISIKDTLNDTVSDTVTYSSELGANGDGNSVQKINGNWLAALPTPGAANNNETAENGPQQNENIPPAQSESWIIGAHVSEPKQAITVDAGAMKQIALAGADAVFNGVIYGFEKEIISNGRFVWSFGDGSIKEGNLIAHMYRYPGEYVVILDGSSGAYSASDKILMTVIPADIFIDSVGAYDDFFISLKNDTKHEINLEGWVLRSGSAHFVIPSNTFIVPAKNLRFAPNITRLSPNSEVALLYPNGNIASVYNINAAEDKISVIVAPKPLQYESEIKKFSPPIFDTPDIDENFISNENSKEFIAEDAQTAALVSADLGNVSDIRWLAMLVILLAISIGSIFFFRKDKSPAEQFEIIEEKNK